MNKHITVTPRKAYGVTRYYPSNPLASLICDLLGVRTLTEAHIGKLKALGYTCQAQPEAPTKL